MGSPVRTSAVVERDITRLWQELLAQAGHKDPTRTLLPSEGPSAAEVEALEPPTGIRRRFRNEAQPLAEIDPQAVIGTHSFVEFNRRYRLRNRLDEGGMGQVFIARQHALAREVAVKVLRKDESTTRRLLFRAEALVTAYLEHPNIVSVYDAADQCLVMRWVRGSSLDGVLSDRPAADLPRAVDMLLSVCDAIAFAHSRGIIHRDIKAENVMVGEFGEVVLLDWGLALAVGPDPDGIWRAPRLDRCQSVCAGTPGCLPPEVARGDRASVGTGTDVHMLGGLLYHILTGRMPFEAENSEKALLLAACNDFPSLAERAPTAPVRLVRACVQAMTFTPAQRPDVAAFAAELNAWLVRSDAREIAPTGEHHAFGSRAGSWWRRLLRSLLHRR